MDKPAVEMTSRTPPVRCSNSIDTNLIFTVNTSISPAGQGFKAVGRRKRCAIHYAKLAPAWAALVAGSETAQIGGFSREFYLEDSL